MKKLLLILGVIAIGAVGYYVWAQNRNGEKVTSLEETTVKVERGPIRVSVSSTGRIESNLDVEIMSQASGEIINLPYDISDSVEKGALLVELDPEDEERSVQKAKVTLASSQAKLAQARQNYEVAKQTLANDESLAKVDLESAKVKYEDAKAKSERMKKLLENKRVSEEECETAQTSTSLALADLNNAKTRLKEIAVDREALETKHQDIILAECQVESDTISLETTQERLKETKVYAPISGTISDKFVQIGTIVSSPMSNVGGGTALFTLSDLSRIFVVASVDESDIGKIEVGQQVDVTADAFSDRHFPGKVIRIATKGDNVSNVVTFEVKIEVLGRDKNILKPEMTANVDILVADKRDVLLLPAEVIHGSGPRQFVLLPGGENSKEERHPIVIGVNDGIQVEIQEGLVEGQEVLRPAGSQGRWTQGGQRENSNQNRMGPPMMMGGPPPPP